MAKKIEIFEGKPVFVAENSKKLAAAVAKYEGTIEPPYVVKMPSKSTEVKEKAFSWDETVGVVLLPDSIKCIEDSSFCWCKNLTRVIFPSSLLIIERAAFDQCSNLTDIYIPASVTKVVPLAFRSCPNLKSIKVDPDNPVYDSRDNCNAIIEKASNKLLLGCKNTIIPDSVTEIGDFAFYDCRQLTDLQIPTSVTKIGNNAFYGCGGLTEIHIPDSVTEIGYSAFCDCCGITSIRIPKSVHVLEGHVFSNTGLTEVEIPDTITELGGTFEDCPNLVSIKIPASVIEISGHVYSEPGSAFSGCVSLISIEIDPNNPKYYSPKDSNVIIEKATNTLIFGCKSSIIPDTVTKIDDSAFSHCGAPANLHLPATVNEIGYDAFAGCRSLVSITIPDSVTEIGDRAFCRCKSLTNITIPESVTKIGRDVFEECVSLSDIKIPDSVTEIGDVAFYDCESLTSIRIPDAVINIGRDAFKGCTSLKEVYIKDSRLIKNTGIKKDAKIISENRPKSILPETFDGKPVFIASDSKKLAEVVAKYKKYGGIAEPPYVVGLPDNIDMVKKYAFRNDETIGVVLMSDFIRAIDCSFYECKNLTGIYISDFVSKIDPCAFKGCVKLTDIKVDQNNRKFDNRGDCNAVIETSTNKLIVGCKNTIIPGSVTEIGECAFYGCENLSSIIIPDSVTKIGSWAFKGCMRLRSIDIPDSIIEIEKDAFQDCDHLKIRIKNRNLLKNSGII